MRRPLPPRVSPLEPHIWSPLIKLYPHSRRIGAEGLPLLPWTPAEAATVDGKQIGFDLPIHFSDFTRVYRFRFAVEVIARRALLGVEAVRRELTDVTINGQHYTSGAAVKRVLPESAAERVGIAPGEVILAINGRGTRTPEEMVDEINAIGPDRVVALLVYNVRQGSRVLKVKFGRVP